MPALTFRSRLVEAVGSPWLRAEDEIHDEGVARDFLSSLRSAYGAAVVLLMSGGVVAGEWLCGDGDEPNAELRRPGIRRSRESVEWFASRPSLTAWELCGVGTWLAHAAASAGVAPALLADAAEACSRAAAAAAGPTPDGRDVPDAWADAFDYAGHARAAATQARSASDSGLAGAAYDAAEVAVSYAETAIALASPEATSGRTRDPEARGRITSDLVRKHVQAIEYLRALRV